MGARSVASGPPNLIKKYPAVAVSGPALVFDWRDLGLYFTALAFMVVNKGGSEVTATPEMSPDGTNIVTVGVGVPAALAVPVGGTSYDPYGIDLLAPYWRLWLDGAGEADVYVFGLKRGA